MKIKKIMILAVFTCLMIAFGLQPVCAHASDGEEYITITVDALDDSDMKYALDSDDPKAFGDSNEFRVPAGTSHTIYVKDAAGNITSQHYEPEEETSYPYTSEKDVVEDEDDTDTRKINIDLELGNTDPEDTYDLSGEEPTEPGTASVASKIKTDGSDNAEKVFYTFSTKEGETLYLVIDQGQGADNVYLLDTVSLTDLRVLADGQTYDDSEKEKQEDNLLSILNDENSTDDPADTVEAESKPKSSARGNGVIVIILAAVGGGAYYYLKIYRNKKDEAMDIMDAMDIDEFAPEDGEAGDEGEELAFEYDDSEKERFLEDLISEGEYLDADPDEYATSHIDDEGTDGDLEHEDEEGDDMDEYEGIGEE